MAQSPTTRKLGLTRDQLAAFLQDHEQIRQFENLFSVVNSEVAPNSVTEVTTLAQTAYAIGNEALAGVSALNDLVSPLVTAPPPTGGTVTSVDASGGTTGLTFTGGPITTSGTLTLSGTLVAVNGGTGFSSYTVGDILFASSTTALSKLADVATGNALISGGVGVAPLYGKIGLTTHVSGTLAVGNGGTGTATAFTAGSVVFAGASGVYSQNNTQLFWDNANNRLGVGNATPAATLDVTGNIRMSGSNPNIELNSGGPQVYVPAASTLAFATGGGISTPVERFRIGSAGQWGIGGATYGTSGQVFTSGGASAAPTWTTPTTGTVTSVDASGGTTGLTFSGGPITTSGTLTLAGTLGVANGGTGTATAFTAGSVVFAGASGVYSQNSIVFASSTGIYTENNTQPSPSQKLHVNGNALFGSSVATQYSNLTIAGTAGIQAADPLFNFVNAAGSTRFGYLYHTGSGGNIELNNQQAGAMLFSTNNTERMRILTGGNVGIGVSAPAVPLEVSTTIRATGLFQRFDNSGLSLSGGTVFNTTGAGISLRGSSSAFNVYGMEFYAGGSERMRILTGGDVGIGTGAPGRKLDVQGSGSITVRSRSTDTSGITVGILAAEHASGSSLQVRAGVGFTNLISTGATDPLIFSANSAEAMRILTGGNVGIGTTSPAERLTVNSASSEFAIQWSGPGNEWVLASAANRSYIRNKTASVETLTILNAGNIGIGTSSPDANAKLDVAGTVRSGVGGSDPGTGAAFYFVGSGSFQTVIGGAAFAVNTGANNARTEKMRVTDTGNVGIGTSSPATKLHVYAASGYNEIRVASGANNLGLAIDGSAAYLAAFQSMPLTFQTNSTERMRIASSGNVGIGTTSPGVALDVAGTIRSVRNNAEVRITTATGYGWRTGTTSTASTLGYMYFQGTTDNFATSFIDSMAIDSTGKVGIGTTSPAYKLQVNASSGANQVAYFVNDSAGSSLSGVAVSINGGGNNTSSYHFAGVTQTVSLWYLYGNGTTSYTSDIRVKKNVTTTRDGYLEDVCKLRVVKYNWYNDSDDTPRELGFIAQEVEQVFPGLVQDAMHPTKDGEIHKVLKGSVLMPIMLKALQEANAKIDALTARVTQLEGN